MGENLLKFICGNRFLTTSATRNSAKLNNLRNKKSRKEMDASTSSTTQPMSKIKCLYILQTNVTILRTTRFYYTCVLKLKAIFCTFHCAKFCYAFVSEIFEKQIPIFQQFQN